MREAKISEVGRQIGQCTGRIQRKILDGFLFEFLQPGRILAVEPPDRGNRHGFKAALHAIFMLEPVRHHIKLQNSNPHPIPDRYSASAGTPE